MIKIGMYGGSFDPLHNGHLRCIEEALNNCDKLFLILSYSKDRDRVNYKVRATWLNQVLRTYIGLGLIEVRLVEDKYSTKETYDWEQGKADILKACGVGRFDIVFCGSEYRSSGIFERLYGKDSVIHYVERTDISSTNIWECALRHWEEMPGVVRQYFIKKVLIIGGESTGKSTLTELLAQHYNTTYVREIGRDISDRTMSEFTMPDTDFVEIMIRHKAEEYNRAAEANRVLFMDTDAITTMFYCNELISNPEIMDKTYNLGKALAEYNKYDLILFLEPDVAFVQDGTRNEEIGANRRYYSDKLEEYYKQLGYRYFKIMGGYRDRFDKAVELVDKYIFN